LYIIVDFATSVHLLTHPGYLLDVTISKIVRYMLDDIEMCAEASIAALIYDLMFTQIYDVMY